MVVNEDSDTRIGYREAETREVQGDLPDIPNVPYAKRRESQEEVEGKGVKGGGDLRSFTESEVGAHVFKASESPENAVRTVLEREGLLEATAKSGYYVDAKIVFAGNISNPEYQSDCREMDMIFGPYQFSKEDDGVISVSRPLSSATSYYKNRLSDMVPSIAHGNPLTDEEKKNLEVMIKIERAYPGSVQEGRSALAESGKLKAIQGSEQVDAETADLFSLTDDSGMHESLEAAKKEERRRKIRKTTQIFPWKKDILKKKD